MKRKERAAETEAALKAAAKRLFATRGYLNTKITDITAEAGRAAGSFYNHFTGKEELLEALLADLAEASDETVAEDGHRADFSDPAAVRFHVAAYWRFFRENRATMLALQQAALVNETFVGKLDEFARTQADEIADHLDHVARPPAGRGVSIAMMYALVDTFARTYQGELPDDEAVEALTRFVYRGLNGRDY
ncbi:TetR/AcrR family transcriptional regulator [Amycolatopsis rhizosphaerae]|uniref:TetR/AcrR family transcriptional regulator n=1 Tax=Amycolatopsis rhizosphaerae TaxID=2053003 RepID=A0A558BIU5_9PSEU|nr:TetR/AcrR family transcriptional regulator [Amycolatopsis rhizosphaerae]TVT36411.1 TetR/AcrR family transcriptional regulator [Amycolatopsis rhizosphaerae]